MIWVYGTGDVVLLLVVVQCREVCGWGFGCDCEVGGEGEVDGLRGPSVECDHSCGIGFWLLVFGCVCMGLVFGLGSEGGG